MRLEYAIYTATILTRDGKKDTISSIYVDITSFRHGSSSRGGVSLDEEHI
jgi:hypothetical protein